MALEPMKVGVIGCGNISGAYLDISRKFEILDVVAVADLDAERARRRAEEFDVPEALSVEQLLARPEIETVLNLTTPQAHRPVAVAALEAGKHVYNEKPLGVTREDGRAILELAQRKGLRVGCAPDTFLGGGHQTARRLIDEGAIGRPVAATAFMMCPGHEGWHPDPEFYYEIGGGPMMDMGPYYLTDLTMLLGPIRRVTASAEVLISPRVIGSEPKRGQQIEVRTPDHIAGTMEFACGAVGTIITSFAVQRASLPCIEIYGTDGSLTVPDPNGFGGTVRLFDPNSKQWTEPELSHSYLQNNRSIGLADMAYSLRTGRPQRVTGEQAYHVLDVMHGFLDAAKSGRHYEPESTFDRPAPLPAGLPEGQLDE